MEEISAERGGWFTRLKGVFGPRPETAVNSASDPVAEDAIVEQEASAAPLDDDSPIRTAAQDRFGIDPFAGIVARSLASQGSAEGTVVAINGPWGSGKSSAVNLVIEHLRLLGGDRFDIIPFNPWWFSGSDQLARNFLEEIGTCIGGSLRADGLDAFKGIASRLTKVDTYVEAGKKLGDSGIGSGLATLLFSGRSVEDDHARLASALRDAGKQFVVVIDDIDRLNPDEALQMFQLVKSVGRLPHVSYLLAFDRLLIERLLQERYPSEGGRYLEKVLQATFDLPDPSPQVLRAMTLEVIERIADVPEDEMVRFMNVFEDVVMPRLTSPRQVVRYVGALRVNWPAVMQDVDSSDFIGIEAIRVFEPTLYRSIRANGSLVRGEDHESHEPQSAWAERVDVALLERVEIAWRQWAKLSLQRLFPQLEGPWGNMHFGNDWQREWDLARRVCSAAHFPTYFSYAVPAETLTQAERQELIEATADLLAVRELILGALMKSRSDGGTRAALMLDALVMFGEKIPIESVPTMLAGLFSIADDLGVDADAARGFSIANNTLRLHWIVNAQLRDRIPIEKRSGILPKALEGAQLGWRMNLCDRLVKDHDAQDGKDRSDKVPLVVEGEARGLQAEAERKLIVAAHDKSILRSNSAISLFWRLLRLSDGETLVRQLTDELLETDDGTIRLARMVTSMTWSQGMGFAGLSDRVARGSPRVSRDSLAQIADAELLHAQVLALSKREDLNQQDRRAAALFLKGWDSHGMDED